MNIEPFKRQLHVFYIIIVVQILSPIMHGKILDKIYGRIQAFMLDKMLVKFGNLYQLMERSRLTYQQYEHAINEKPFHAVKLAG